jgi:hypothetical protein
MLLFFHSSFKIDEMAIFRYSKEEITGASQIFCALFPFLKRLPL